MKRLLSAIALAVVLTPAAFAAPPATFADAKVVAKQKVYLDQANSAQGDLYCGCKWTWVGKSGGRIDPASCGLQPRKQQNRADRTEWEHIVPAWTFGHQRQCWQKGGRSACEANDPVFSAMEADLFNLYPAVGEVNGDRSNLNYGMAQGVPAQYGQCATRVDFAHRVTEPRDAVKGLVARTTFYMFDRYGLNMSRQQQQLLMAWDKQYPVSGWERERDRRIAAVMGHGNPFVSGARQWSSNYKPVGDGLSSGATMSEAGAGQKTAKSVAVAKGSVVIGNRNSHVYHLPSGCPSYDRVAAKNQMTFASEQDAQAAGYRKAKNCQ